MATIVCFCFSFFILMFAVIKGISLGYALAACFVLFSVLALFQKHRVRNILSMGYQGAKKSFDILAIFFLIGAIISVWITSGTLPTIMFYCMKLVAPRFFVVFSFLISCLVSFLIGTSFGTTATIGVALISLGNSGGISPLLMAGAIISGAYFGDRASPMSSTVAIVSNLTDTDVMDDVKAFHVSSFFPLLISILFYGFFSWLHPLQMGQNPLPEKLSSAFVINPWMMLPALLMFFLPLFRVPVKRSMFLSILCALAESCFIQHTDFLSVLWAMWDGFTGKGSSVEGILQSGGILSMLKTYVIVILSCALAGLFEGIHIFDGVKERLVQWNKTPRIRFGMTAIVGVITAAFGCTQTISIILSREILSSCYGENEKIRLATDLSNTGVILSGLIPWSLACLVPTATLGVSHSAFIPYAFYLYCIPVFTFLFYRAPNYQPTASLPKS